MKRLLGWVAMGLAIIALAAAPAEAHAMVQGPMILKEALKLALEKGAKTAAKEAINTHFNSEEASKWLKTLGLADTTETLEPRLLEIERNLGELQGVVDKTHLLALFNGYDKSDVKRKVFCQDVERAANEQNLKNASAAFVASQGAVFQVKQMITSLLQKTTGSNESRLKHYAEILISKQVDVHTFVNRMDAIVDDLEAKAIEVLVLRVVAAQQATPQDNDQLAAWLKDLVDEERKLTLRARRTAELLDQLADKGTEFRIRHEKSGKYLTAIAEGLEETGRQPFDAPLDAWPQVILYEKAEGQREQKSSVSPTSGARITYYSIEMSDRRQLWRIQRKAKGNIVVVTLYNPGSQKYLGQATRGTLTCLRAEPVEWRVIVDRGTGEQAPILVAHESSNKALDGNGRTTYTGARPAYENPFMRWSLIPKPSSK